MSRVNIIGVVMPENLWLEDNVASLDAFKNELSQCDDGLELYIDSPGGDVLTSNSMSVLISEWCLNHPNAKPTCKIGGLCASAAANIVAKLPKSFTVSCYEDTLVMYHSAYAMITGGPESLRDNAVLLDLVNSVVIDKLLAKTTLDEQRVRTAFKEGREMWLSGKELKDCGLVDSVIDEKSEGAVIQAVYGGTTKGNADALRYAACVTSRIKAKLEAHMSEENKPEVEEETLESTKAQALATEETTEETDTKAECGDNETETKAETKAEDEVEKDDIEEEVEKEKDDDTDDTDEVEALKAENASLKAEVESLKAIVAKYQPSATPSAKASNADWMTLVRALNAKHLPEQEYAKAYIALKQTHQNEFDAFMNKHTMRSF